MSRFIDWIKSFFGRWRKTSKANEDEKKLSNNVQNTLEASGDKYELDPEVVKELEDHTLEPLPVPGLEPEPAPEPEPELPPAPPKIILSYAAPAEDGAGEAFDRLCDKIRSFDLTPAKVREPYEQCVDFGLLNNLEFSLEGEFPKGLECTFNNGLLLIAGKPEAPFDGNLEIEVRLSLARTIKTPLIVNPDPWDLWQDLPAPEDAPYQKADKDSACAVLPSDPPLSILAASQRGRSHAHEAKFRDDDFKISVADSPDKWTFLAAADGAGSAPFSREGSRIACETALEVLRVNLADDGDVSKNICEHLRKILADRERENRLCADPLVEGPVLDQVVRPIFHRVAHSSYSAIDAEVKRFNEENGLTKDDVNFRSISNYHTTLLTAAIKKITYEGSEGSTDAWVIASYWVGDGGLAIYKPNGSNIPLVLGIPDAGEFAGQTRFLTMSSEIAKETIFPRVRLAVVRDFKALLLMTDGITDPFFPSESNLSSPEYWDDFWNKVMPEHFPGVLNSDLPLEDRAKNLLDDLMFKVKGNHDDRTIVLVVNDQEPKEYVDKVPEPEQEPIPETPQEPEPTLETPQEPAQESFIDGDPARAEEETLFEPDDSAEAPVPTQDETPAQEPASGVVSLSGGSELDTGDASPTEIVVDSEITASGENQTLPGDKSEQIQQ